MNRDTYNYEQTVCPMCGSEAMIVFLKGKFILYQCSCEECEYKFKNEILKSQ